MISAGLWGNIWGPEISMLDVHGSGKLRTDGSSEFLIWELPHELKVGDRVGIYFEGGSASSPKGRSFEADPSENERRDFSIPPAEAQLRQLEARPTQNAALVWAFSLNGGSQMQVRPDPTRQHLSLHLLWNDHHPDRLRVNLSKTSVREIAGRAGGEEVFVDYVPVGSRIEVTIGI